MNIFQLFRISFLLIEVHVGRALVGIALYSVADVIS